MVIFSFPTNASRGAGMFILSNKVRPGSELSHSSLKNLSTCDGRLLSQRAESVRGDRRTALLRIDSFEGEKVIAGLKQTGIET
jgi:hypothetical protein